MKKSPITHLHNWDNCETLLECSPDGILINDREVDLGQLQHKFLALQNGHQGFGVLQLLKIEHSIACLESAIVETMRYINGLRARREEVYDVLES